MDPADGFTGYIQVFNIKKLSVRVDYCPAVKHLRETGRDVSKWFYLTTETVMQTFADCAGLIFNMESYDEETGSAAYSFSKKAEENI